MTTQQRQVPFLAYPAPAGRWLQDKLAEASLTQKQLADWLDVSAPFVNQLITGEYRIPPAHILSIREFLKLTDEGMSDFLALIDLQEARDDLRRYFVPGKATKRSKSPSAAIDRELRSFFSAPAVIFERLTSQVEALADADCLVYGIKYRYLSIRAHLIAAVRVVRDLRNFLSNPEFPLFSSRNIVAHMTYPLNYYVAFFLENVGPGDGPCVADLKDEIILSLLANAEFRSSRTKADNIIAHHSIHMLARYRPGTRDLPASFGKALSDTHAWRMASFGEVSGQ